MDNKNRVHQLARLPNLVPKDKPSVVSVIPAATPDTPKSVAPEANPVYSRVHMKLVTLIRAQDQASRDVYGEPAAVTDAGLSKWHLSLQAIGGNIVQRV